MKEEYWTRWLPKEGMYGIYKDGKRVGLATSFQKAKAFIAVKENENKLGERSGSS